MSEGTNFGGESGSGSTLSDEGLVPLPASPEPIPFSAELLPRTASQEHKTLTVTWKDKEIRVICHGAGGGCHVVALCNVLLLRGEISIADDRELLTTEDLHALLSRQRRVTTSDNNLPGDDHSLQQLFDVT